jgi:MFS family permease
MGLIEKIPYLALPMTAYLLRWISQDAALWLFMLVVAWRGFTGGMVALPWQEVIATVIPSTVRSRFLGVSRTIGRFLGVLGSATAGLILAEIAYPNNYALSFLIGAVFIWLSFVFFCRTIEPRNDESVEEKKNSLQKIPLLDLVSFKRILKDDQNFRRYLTSRVLFQLGSMAAGFLAVYGIQHFSLADEQAAIFSAFLFASGTIGFSFWGVFGDRIGSRKMLLISDSGQLVVLVLAFLAPDRFVYYLVFIVFGFAQSGYIIGEMILGMELGVEAERPIYLGLARSVPGIFILIAPLVGGLIVSLVGYRWMFIVASCFSVAGIYFLYHVRDRHNSVAVNNI